MYIFDITVEDDELVNDFWLQINLQIEIFVPNWTVCFVQCLCAYSCVAQFEHSKRIAVAYHKKDDTYNTTN